MWALGIKGTEVVKSGYNLVLDGTFDAFLPTEEVYAKQSEKLEYIDGKLRVKEGMEILPLILLNETVERVPDFEMEETVDIEPPKLITPENL